MSENVYFDQDAARRCRARGHVFDRDFRHPNGKFEMQTSMNCFRCGVTFVASEAEHAEVELASAPA